jgi:predicted site-specific integrase-resolvase
MSRFIKIGEAAKVLGVSIQTLRRWEETGYLIPERKSSGKTRYYSLEQLIGNKIDEVSFKEELAQDVLEIITGFSARLYGSRSRKKEKVLDVAQALLSDVK